MTLKNIRLARAEDLSEEIRKEYSLPDKGLVIIESNNSKLSEKIISLDDGIMGYLLSLGNFKDVPVDE